MDKKLTFVEKILKKIENFGQVIDPVVNYNIVYRYYTNRVFANQQQNKGEYNMKETTLQILKKCKITSKYKGYTYLPVAVEIASRHLGDSLCIMKNIYPVIGQIFHASPREVERNIHTVVERCWLNNRTYIVEIMGYDVRKCPGNGQFIDALVYYILNRNPQLDLREIV